MINNIINYFESLNGVGQALFIVGVLLVITFIVLLIVVLKPEPKSKKVYGENSYTHSEAELEEKLKDIDNITDDDININNDKTRNLKSIVDELKSVENKNTTLEEMIERYEDEQENTAIISVEELLKKNKPFSYERRETRLPYDNKKDDDDMLFIDDTDVLLPTLSILAVTTFGIILFFFKIIVNGPGMKASINFCSILFEI